MKQQNGANIWNIYIGMYIYIIITDLITSTDMSSRAKLEESRVSSGVHVSIENSLSKVF